VTKVPCGKGPFDKVLATRPVRPYAKVPVSSVPYSKMARFLEPCPLGKVRFDEVPATGGCGPYPFGAVVLTMSLD
jgi:hypothetical protein